MSAGDGNGWLPCACGKTHWGVHGAAGLLVVGPGDVSNPGDRDEHDGTEASGAPRVLLQLRAGWTHNGGTWALPGGARDSHESARDASLREASEETSLDLSALDVVDEVVDDHVTWSYTTIIARSASTPQVDAINGEGDAMRWWRLDEVDELPLHYGFAASWPALRVRLATLS